MKNWKCIISRLRPCYRQDYVSRGIGFVGYIQRRRIYFSWWIFVLKLEEDGSVSRLDRYVFQKVRSLHISGRYEKGLKVVPFP